MRQITVEARMHSIEIVSRGLERQRKVLSLPKSLVCRSGTVATYPCPGQGMPANP